MAQYLIQNNSRRHVSVGKTILAIRSPARPGSAWISEDLYNSSDVQQMLSNGILVLLESVGVSSSPVEEDPAEEPVVEVAEVVEEPAVEEVEKSSEPEEVEEVEEPTEPEEAIDYSSFKMQDLKAIAKEKGLDIKGIRKKQELIDLLEGN